MGFFDHIYSHKQEGTAFIVVRDEAGSLNVQAKNQWPQEESYMEKYCALRSDEDVYYSVAIFPSGSRTAIDHAATAKIVWADADICPPEAFRVEPSIIVQTSPPHKRNEVCDRRDKTGKECNGHYHVLWELDTPYCAQEVEQVARRISYAHHDEGCDNGWTLTKILRVPETSNTKFRPPYELPAPKYTGHIYTLAEIEEAYADVDIEASSVAIDGAIPELPDDAYLIDLERRIEGLGLDSLYLERPRSGESWSERLYRLQLDLFRNGFTEEEVFFLARNSASNKYNPEVAGELTQTGEIIPKRSDPDGYLWREVQKAQRDFETEVVLPVGGAPLAFRDENLTFLRDEDREVLADNPTFIDDYVAWALSKSPDHAETFSQSLAWLVLSSAYGNRACIQYSWGVQHLNFWMYLLAGSTKDHKSTAVKLMKDVLNGVAVQTMEKVLINADFTAEGLTKELTERDGMVTTVINDEVQGFFREITMKQYRAGTKERLTKFYDGEVPQMIRSTSGGGTEKEATTVFNFLGAGITDQATGALTREDFESGFLFRSVWSVAPNRPYEKGDSNIPTNFKERDLTDTLYRSIVESLARNISRYEADNPKILGFTPEAEQRINNFSHSLQLYAQRVGDPAIGRGVDRLRDTVAKCAALLAYHNRQDQITEFEMMVAISHGERWFADFQKVLAAVSSTDFGRKCDDVETFIAHGRNGVRANSEIYRKFSLKPAEYSEITNSLRFQGRIRMVKDQPNSWEILG